MSPPTRPPIPPPELSREQRQARRAHWHGGLIAAWGAWTLAFGARNFQNPSFAAFGFMPFWVWGAAYILAGAAIWIMANRHRAMAIGMPGRLAALCWFAVAAMFLIGDFRTTGVPTYTGLAWNAYYFLVRE